MTWVKNLKDWWWLATLILGAVVFIATLPKRLETVEAGVTKAREENVEQYRILDRLTYIAEQNQQIQKQQLQQPNQMAPAPEVWKAQDQEGYWYCTNGQESWWPSETGRCE